MGTEFARLAYVLINIVQILVIFTHLGGGTDIQLQAAKRCANVVLMLDKRRRR